MTTAEGNKPFQRTLSNSMAASFNTTGIEVPDYYMGQIQLTWVGFDGTTGSAYIETSADNTNWQEVGCADTSAVITGATGIQIWELLWATGSYYRLAFIPGNGTVGTATTKFVLKRRMNG